MFGRHRGSVYLRLQEEVLITYTELATSPCPYSGRDASFKCLR